MRIQFKINKVFSYEIPDETDTKSPEEVIEAIAEVINWNNEKVEHLFFEHLEVICSECGVSLNLDEEEQDLKCVSCSAQTERVEK